MSGFRGIVTAFDREVGLGTVRREDGAEFEFHCIEIADGSRAISEGTAVQFALLCKLGRYEAAQVAPA